MSVQAIAWALAQRVPAVPKLVLIAIANRADGDGDNAYPGQKAIANVASMSVRTVQRHTAWLEERGYLTRIRRSRKDGSRTSDRYILHMPHKATGCRLGTGVGRQGDTVGRAMNRPLATSTEVVVEGWDDLDREFAWCNR
jgi:CTP-dependent riboflavin kinase